MKTYLDVGYPMRLASFPSVLSVATVERDEMMATFSEYKDQVEMAGPGIDIVSTVPGTGAV